ncbi:MAG: alpha/beta hydrolase-fold protein [Chthoniobacterales bacterium]
MRMHPRRQRSLVTWLGFAALVCLLTPAAFAGNPARVPVPFSITQDVGAGNEVFVSGAHRDFSSGGIQQFGVKLHWSAGNIWSGSVALEAGAAVTYTYNKHAISTSSYCDSSSTALGSSLVLTVPSAPAPPYAGKFVRYYSSWSSANIVYRDNTQNGSFTQVPMTRVGQGRTPAENVFELGSVAAPADEIEFVFNDGAGHYDNAPAPPQNTPQGAAPAIPVPYQSLSAPYNYRTSLDVFTVQDGQVYNYQPPATVSSSSITNRFVNSSVDGIPGRNVHIYLPRGYPENTNKRYPVVYFHDGQNVFFPGGTFGTWDADRIANYEIGQGRMREAILVAIDNGNDYGSNRLVEYIPPGDQLTGQPAGTADKYVQFLRDNVLPTLDYNYRTLNQPGQPAQPAANLTAGSSLGGLLTAYMGMTNSAVFGTVGIFSPAFWAGPNFRTNTLLPAPKLPLSIYLDIGSAESSSSQDNPDTYWLDAFTAYNKWLDVGYAVNRDLLMYPKCGAVHNEAAWSGRLPTFYQFALSLWSEPNLLALAKFPPHLDILSLSSAAGRARLHFLAPLGVPLILGRSTDLTTWPVQSALPAATSIFEDRIVDEVFDPASDKRFWRLSY